MKYESLIRFPVGPPALFDFLSRKASAGRLVRRRTSSASASGATTSPQFYQNQVSLLSSPFQPILAKSSMDSRVEQTAAICFVSFIGILFLAINSSSIYNYAFPFVTVIHAFSVIVILFLYLQVFDREEECETRERLKAVIWVVTTTIGVTSAARVTMIESLACTWWVWALVGSISFYSFYSFFMKEDHEMMRGRDRLADPVGETYQIQV
ncbi:hypothetical protein ACLOJK_014418 [Asimina triloba]